MVNESVNGNLNLIISTIPFPLTPVLIPPFSFPILIKYLLCFFFSYSFSLKKEVPNEDHIFLKFIIKKLLNAPQLCDPLPHLYMTLVYTALISLVASLSKTPFVVPPLAKTKDESFCRSRSC